MLVDYLFFAFLLTTLIQLLFWFFIFSKLAFYSSQNKTPKSKFEPVSIVICAKNEAANIQQNLPVFLAQDYPQFEIVVVNDNSSDNTLTILLDIQRKNPTLRVINLDTVSPPGKKAALSAGINAAKFEILLLTDADCQPTSKYWVQEMQSVLQKETSIGLGYSPYQREKGFLNRFIRFEAIYTATQYLSFALIGRPYMGVGRNLVYRKQLFRSTGGFQSHQHIASGDDDLFINAVANKHNTNINIKPQAFIYSTPKRTWRGYYRQKSRHLTTGTQYKSEHQMMLGALSATHFGHYALALAVSFFPAYQWFVVGCYLARMGVVWYLSARILRVLKERSLVPWIPVLDFLYQFYYLAFAPILLIGKRDQWK